jgi:hypothetical protein
LSDRNRNSSLRQNSLSPEQRGVAIGLRPVALLLMVAGAAGFILSLVIFGEQVLCLLGSTTLTFIGLGLTVAARRQTESAPAYETAPKRGQMMVDSVDVPEEPSPPAWVESDTEEDLALTDLAVETFQTWGAEVAVEAQRGDRCVLHIQATDGKTYVALVYNQPSPVELADVRALFALITNAGGQGGFIISEGIAETDTLEWARRRRIALVDRTWLRGAGI